MFRHTRMTFETRRFGQRRRAGGRLLGGPHPSTAPFAEYNGHEEHLHEPVTGMNQGEHPWLVIPEAGAHKHGHRKAKPHPESKNQRTFPAPPSR